MTFFVPFVFLVVAGVAIGLAVSARRRVLTNGGRVGFQPDSLNVALVASVAAILALTLTPMDGAHEVQLLPLGDLVEAFVPPVDKTLLLGTASNVLLFLPFGAALRLRGFSIGRTALYGFVLSALVESAQLLFVSGRTTSVDDLLLNILGAVFGHALQWRWVPARGAPP